MSNTEIVLLVCALIAIILGGVDVLRSTAAPPLTSIGLIVLGVGAALFVLL